VYKRQIAQLQEFNTKKLADFADDEIKAFNELSARNFKSYHIVELLELKASNKNISKALTELSTIGDVEKTLKVLKNEQASAHLIKAFEEIKNAKNVKNFANFVKELDALTALGKLIAKVL
jgi:TnpA family transposase